MVNEEKQPKIYDVYISCSAKDAAIAEQLACALRECEVSVFYTDSIFALGSFWNQISDAIRTCRTFIPIISEIR